MINWTANSVGLNTTIPTYNPAGLLNNSTPTWTPPSFKVPVDGEQYPTNNRQERAAHNDAKSGTKGKGAPPRYPLQSLPVDAGAKVLTASSPVGNTSAGPVLSSYAHALWRGTTSLGGSTAEADKLRANALAQMNPASRVTQELSRRFNLMTRYVNEMSAANQRYVSDFPRYRTIIEEETTAILARSVEKIVDGFPQDNPVGQLRYYVQPRIAVQMETERRIEEKTLGEIAGIKKFWVRAAASLTQQRQFIDGGISFKNIEEMEKNCPKGTYVPFYRQWWVATDPLTYKLSFEPVRLDRVYVDRPGCEPRQVSFQGETWMYSDEETLDDRRPPGSQANSTLRHQNTHWNPDPRAVEARARSASLRWSQVVPPPPDF
ncbi:hypothetical protein BH09PSE5_BH09PSE5_04410 [soil metagenome]